MLVFKETITKSKGFMKLSSDLRPLLVVGGVHEILLAPDDG